MSQSESRFPGQQDQVISKSIGKGGTIAPGNGIEQR